MKRIGAFVLLIVVVVAGFFLYQSRKARQEFREVCDVQRIRFGNRTANFKIKNSIDEMDLKASKVEVEKILSDVNLALPTGQYNSGKSTSPINCEFQRVMPAPGFFTASFQVVNVVNVPAELDQFAALLKILKTSKDSLSCDKNGEQAQAVQNIELFEEQMPNYPDTSVVIENDSVIYVADVAGYKGKRYTAQIKFPVKNGSKIAIYNVETSSEDLRNAVVLKAKVPEKSGHTVSGFESCLSAVLKNAQN